MVGPLDSRAPPCHSPARSRGLHKATTRTLAGSAPGRRVVRAPPTGGGALHQHYLPPCPGLAPPSALAADDTLGPDNRAPSIGSILCMGSTTPHRFAVSGALLGLLVATVERPHLMYAPGRGGAPQPGGSWHKKTALPAGSDSRKDWDIRPVNQGPGSESVPWVSPSIDFEGTTPRAVATSIFSIIERGQSVKPRFAYLFVFRPGPGGTRSRPAGPGTWPPGLAPGRGPRPAPAGARERGAVRAPSGGGHPGSPGPQRPGRVPNSTKNSLFC